MPRKASPTRSSVGAGHDLRHCSGASLTDQPSGVNWSFCRDAHLPALDSDPPVTAPATAVCGPAAPRPTSARPCIMALVNSHPSSKYSAGACISGCVQASGCESLTTSFSTSTSSIGGRQLQFHVLVKRQSGSHEFFSTHQQKYLGRPLIRTTTYFLVRADSQNDSARLFRRSPRSRRALSCHLVLNPYNQPGCVSAFPSSGAKLL